MFKKLLAATVVFAVCISPVLANGVPYIGGSVGIQANSSNDGNAVRQGGDNARVVPMTIFAGYGATLAQSFYLGGEIFGVPGSFNINDNGLKSTYGYGISFIPGLLFGEHTMGYGRLGLVRTRFNTALSGDNTVTGLQLGLGLQTSIAQNLDLRGEYVFSAYRKISPFVNTLRTDAFNLGLVYTFD